MSDYTIKSPKKLIEVALPLDDINEASAREKSIRHGHPSTLHLWWARRPLASARAVIFAQMVNDPLWRFDMDGTIPSPQEKAAATKKREQLFKIIRDLVKWENTTNEEVLNAAREEIKKSWKETCELNKDHPQAKELFNPEKLPAFHDPFAGGGALPLEAQRLGLESYASDLNPVPVMINKAMIEIPPLFANCKPVHPIDEDTAWYEEKRDFKGAEGLAEDVAYYGKWMRDEAEKKIGHLYPKVKITKEIVSERPDLKEYLNKELTVIAYIWARTVKSPNPAYKDIDVPLASTFVLSKKKGKEAWIEPIVNGKKYTFKVHAGAYPKEAENGTKVGSKGTNFKCLLSGTPIESNYIHSAFQQKKAGLIPMAIVAEGNSSRVYLSADCTTFPKDLKPTWIPDSEMEKGTANLISGRGYGITKWNEIFTERQLVSLSTFSDLIPSAIEKIKADALKAERSDDKVGIEKGGSGALAYAQAVAVYLSFAIDKSSNLWTEITGWMNDRGAFRETFARQAIPMTWDFAEANPFSNSGGNFETAIEKSKMVIDFFNTDYQGFVYQKDAQTQTISQNKVISTDPPYYDNIEYSSLSDFFYVWMRHNLRNIYPSLFTTIATPKKEELIAVSYRHDSKQDAELFFLHGMTDVMRNLANISNQTFPVTIYYAFKQSETSDSGATSNTGWETFLQAVINAGFAINGTWPMRTEGSGRMIAQGTNALASSIVLVCRRRSENATETSRREFLRELKKVMDDAKEVMTQGDETTSPVAPVDLSQAIIGPGMAVFSKYKAVLEADGSAMNVKEALKLINRYMEEDDYDANTLFCKDWYLQYGWEQGVYGEADVLARAKTANLQLLQTNGTIISGQGKVQLTNWKNYKDIEETLVNSTLSTWNLLHQFIHELNLHGTRGAAVVYARYNSSSADVRSLAYTMYTLCERNDRAEDARVYNELIIAWDDIEAASSRVVINEQPGLFD